FDVDKINALTSSNVEDAHKSEGITFDDLKDFDIDKIEALVSYGSMECYRSGWVQFSDLKDFDVDKINALTSSNTQDAYKSEGITFDDLKDFDIDKINELTYSAVVGIDNIVDSSGILNAEGNNNIAELDITTSDESDNLCITGQVPEIP
ncbi:MAG: hypothetical protein P8P83_02650, partial [Rickettsiaceae bacterium]|nr:hypothetical protein [Rickettsiaceae bacterium]